MEKETEEKKDGPGAKDFSLLAMIFAAAWIVVLSLAKALWGILPFSSAPFGLEMFDIILSGVFIGGVFSPVFLSMWLDKIKDIRGK